MIYGLALWWDNFGTRVLFSDSPLSLTFPVEQFWGRAARASWVRRIRTPVLILRRTPHRRFTPLARSSWIDAYFDPAPAQFVEMVKFTVMRA